MLKVNKLPEHVKNYDLAKIVNEAHIGANEVYTKPTSVLTIKGALDRDWETILAKS